MLVLLIIFMVITPMLSKGVPIDMVKTQNPIAMQAADRTDAVLISVTRDGKTYLGRDAVAPGPVDAQSEGHAFQPHGQRMLPQGRHRVRSTKWCWK